MLDRLLIKVVGCLGAKRARAFAKDETGASMVEYAVALIVVTLVGAAIFALGANVGIIIDSSAGAF